MTAEIAMILKQTLTENADMMIQEIDRMMEEDGVDKAIAVGRTQFQTIMKSASNASCVEELCLFISYQESKHQGWDTKCYSEKNKTQRTVAENVIASLKLITESVSKKCEERIKSKELQVESSDLRQIKLRIAEKFLGYLYWKATVVMQKRGG